MLKRITKNEAKLRFYRREPLFYCDPDVYCEGDVKYVDHDPEVIPVTRNGRNDHWYTHVRAIRQQPAFYYDIVWLSGESCADDDCREKCLLNWEDKGKTWGDG